MTVQKIRLMAVLSVLAFQCPAVFENPDFEDSAKYGKVNDHVEIGRFGYNGNGGVRIRPGKRYTYVAPLKKGVRFEKGKRYVFSADICNFGDSTSQIAVEAFDKKTGKYSHGFWGMTAKKLDGGWTHYDSFFIPKVEPEEVDYHFIVYTALSRRHGADPDDPGTYTQADNLAVAEAAPVWELGIVWPTHFKVFKEHGRVRLCSNFVGDFFAEGAEPVYELALVKPDGGQLSAATVSKIESKAFTAVFGRLDYEGPATLAVKLQDRGKTLSEKKIEVVVAPEYKPKKGEVTVAEDGRAFVDGKPFMPIGFYTSLADIKKHPLDDALAQLKEIRAMGFNLIMDYSTYKLGSAAKRKAFYDICAEADIRVLADDFSFRSAAALADPQSAPSKRARELAGYPAVIGFYTMDEASPDRIPALTEVRRRLNAIAPGHIVNTCNIFSPYSYLMTADIAGGDKYPIDVGERDLSGMEAYCRDLEATTMCGWHAPQAYNWANSRPDARDNPAKYRTMGREANENEMLSVALLYASYGVKGFIFYSWFDIHRCPIPEWIERRKTAILGVSKALGDLEPFIMSGIAYEELKREDVKGSHRILIWKDGRGRSRVTIVGIKRDNECSFRLPPSCGKLKSRCGRTVCRDGVWTFKGPEFSCDILED